MSPFFWKRRLYRSLSTIEPDDTIFCESLIFGIVFSKSDILFFIQQLVTFVQKFLATTKKRKKLKVRQSFDNRRCAIFDYWYSIIDVRLSIFKTYIHPNICLFLFLSQLRYNFFDSSSTVVGTSAATIWNNFEPLVANLTGVVLQVRCDIYRKHV